MQSSRRAALVAALALAVAACSESPLTPLESGIQFVAGAAVEDTIDSELTRALEVRVRDSDGQPVVGIVVRFEPVFVLRRVGAQLTPIQTALVSPDGGGYGVLATAVTDAAGQASIRVKLGRVAGEAGVLVSVPTLALRDTARYTVKPGAPVAFEVAPADTAVYIGGTVALHADWIDRYGNERNEPVGFATGSAAIQLAGSTATATTYGLGEVTATSGAAAVTARISVVPRGTIAAFSPVVGSARGIIVFELDGSSRRQVTSAGTAGEQVPYWSPSGDRLVYHSGGSIAHLFVTTIGGVPQALTSASPAAIDAEKWAQYSRDGEWIYYSGYQGGFTWSLWRVRADGTGAAERVGPFAVNAQTDAAPSPSPAGDRVVFWTNRYGGQRLAVLNVATGEFEPIGPTGSTARWSPLGDRIAYIDAGALALIDPDGGNGRTLFGSGFDEWVDWSPDGDWLVASGESGLWVIRVADGLKLPVPHADGMLYPSWRPSPD